MNNTLKILLLKPNTNTTNQIISVPLGSLYLSAYLKKYLGSKVEIRFLDLRMKKNARSALIQELQEFKADVIGISLMTYEKDFLSEHADVFRENAQTAKIVFGGPHATICYDEILRQNEIECVVVGEGEEVFLNIAKRYLEGTGIQDIKGVAYRNGDIVVYNKNDEYIEDLDSIPFPDYGLIDIKDYWGYQSQFNVVLSEKKYASVMTSRACPYNCIYCHNIFGKKFRKRSPENIINEITMLYDRYGVREIHIIDDIFNIDKKRMHKILTMIIESKMKIKFAFPNGLRGDALNEKDLLLLKKAGTYSITLAIETASERLQKVIRKNLNINKVIENINFANKIGVLTRGYFMLGFPGETVKELKSTVTLALKSKLNMANFLIVVPFKGTQLYELAKSMYNQCDTEINANYLSCKSFYEEVTGFNVGKVQKLAYLRFYSIKRLLTLFFKAPRKSYFLLRFVSYSIMLLKA